MPELMLSTSVRTAARPMGVLGSSGGSGQRSSRYSTMATDWDKK